MANGRRLSKLALISALVAACTAPSWTAQQPATPQRPPATTPPAPATAQPPTKTGTPTTSSAISPPTANTSLRFAVIGDTGTGDRPQYEVGAQMAKARDIFPFEFVIMLGDNMYGGERPQDYQRKFELPYKAILDANIPFYASLGNHDDPNQRFYKPFNMNGERYYSYKKDKLGNPGVRFFALDSNYMTSDQLQWLEKELAASDSPWKIAYFHHPLYSSGERHGSEVDLRAQLEPLFLKYGMSVVFAGHEHFYERLRPQKGIYYFTAGGSAKLRVGNIAKSSALTALGFDTDHTYMLVEIAGEQMHFQTLTRSGKRIDSGTITRPATGAATQ